MILLNKEKFTAYLKTIGRDQSWLARKFGITKGYVSQLVNNKCHIPALMIERLLMLTGMRFEDLFDFNGQEDRREFFGKDIYIDEKKYNNGEYKKYLLTNHQ